MDARVQKHVVIHVDNVNWHLVYSIASKYDPDADLRRALLWTLTDGIKDEDGKLLASFTTEQKVQAAIDNINGISHSDAREYVRQSGRAANDINRKRAAGDRTRTHVVSKYTLAAASVNDSELDGTMDEKSGIGGVV